MYNLPTAARIAVTESHGMDARVRIYSPAAGVLSLPILDGKVAASSKARVRRTANLAVDPRWWPASPTDLLAPYGSEAFIERGIILPSGNTVWVPLGMFRLDTVDRKQPVGDDMTVALVDRSAIVADDTYAAPTQTVSGAPTVAEITRLIRRSLPGQVVIDRTGSTAVAAQIEVKEDPWADGVEILADSLGAEVFFDTVGTVVIRPQPSLADTPVWEISDGDAGVLLSAADTLSRQGWFNRVIVSGERSDGTAPVTATVVDDNPLSPTYYNGPAGRRTKRYSSPSLTTVAQCQAVGAALLARYIGGGVQATLEGVVNPALEPGDVITGVRGGVRSALIIDDLETPLGPDGVQPLTTRSIDLPPEE